MRKVINHWLIIEKKLFLFISVYICTLPDYLAVDRAIKKTIHDHAFTRLLTDTHMRQSVCSILQRSTWSWITVVATVVPRPLFKCVWTSADISAGHCQEKKSSWEKRKTRKQAGTSSLSFVDPHDSRTLTATSSSALHRCILAAEAVYPPVHYFGHAECTPKRFANISRTAADRDLRCAIVIFRMTYYALVSSIAQIDENNLLVHKYARCSFSFYTRIDITFCIAVCEDKVTNCFKAVSMI